MQPKNLYTSDMRQIVQRYKAFSKAREYRELIIALVFLVIALVIEYYLSLYAATKASNPVSDIILSNTRVYDVSFFFVWGAIGFWVFFAILCLLDPKKIPFSIKTISLFIVIRAIFVSLTHIGPYPSSLLMQTHSPFLSLFLSNGTLFFSGHTGLPFLTALIFWKNKALRYVMLILSVVFGVVVLLGHLHYTIDVVGAYFITYSIYCLAEHFFKKDREFFYGGIPASSGEEML
jgi:hypothetical protein